MESRAALAALTVACLAGCGAPRTPELEYLPPSGRPAADRSAVVQQGAWLVWGNILDHLQQRNLEIIDLDERSGELAVIYRGDPEPYIDCGWIVTYGRDLLDRVPAAASQSSFLRRRDGRAVTLDRELTLDARMEVRIEPQGEQSLVRADTSYVLTKTILSDGEEPPLHTETIRFRTGQSAAFSAGTTCQPNGNLERVVFDALPAVSLAGG